MFSQSLLCHNLVSGAPDVQISTQQPVHEVTWTRPRKNGVVALGAQKTFKIRSKEHTKIVRNWIPAARVLPAATMVRHGAPKVTK